MYVLLEGCGRAVPWFVRPWGAATPNFPRGDSPRFQSDLQKSDSPQRVIVLRTLHASCTSTRWPSRVRLLMPRPMIVLYRQMAFSAILLLL